MTRLSTFPPHLAHKAKNDKYETLYMAMVGSEYYTFEEHILMESGKCMKKSILRHIFLTKMTRLSIFPVLKQEPKNEKYGTSLE